MAGTLVDHTSLPCPASLLDAEVTFLLAALAPLGVIQYQRYGDQAVGLGRKMPSGQPVEAEGGFNNVAVWVFAVPDADGEGRKVSSVHLGLRADSREQVRAFHAAALAAGGIDNGAPGERFYHEGYYGAFVLTPAGHNLEAVIRGPDRV